MCYKKNIQRGRNTKTHNPDNISGEPLPKELEIIGKKIVDVRRRRIHKTLGPGLLEKVYVPIYRDCHELTKRGLKYLRQIDIPIVYDGITFQEGLSAFGGDVLSHLKLTNKRLGYLINFNVVNIGQGIKRFVL